LGNLVFHAVKSCLKYERIYQEKTLFQTNLDSNDLAFRIFSPMV
jgi:hypothetical protein